MISSIEKKKKFHKSPWTDKASHSINQESQKAIVKAFAEKKNKMAQLEKPKLSFCFCWKMDDFLDQTIFVR